MMRDSGAMQKAVQHQDMSTSQLENMLGGVWALQQTNEDTQEPIIDAMARMGGGGV